MIPSELKLGFSLRLERKVNNKRNAKMKKLILAISIAFLASLAVAKAGGTDWTEWKTSGDVDTLVYRTCEVPHGDQVQHRVEFQNQGTSTVHITRVSCNGSREGANDLGPGATWSCSFTDDNDEGVWTWGASE
jgi:hypothetical protein